MIVELKVTISEQFKSLNLNPKKKEKKKLCTNEVGGVKMKKTHLQSKEHIFFIAIFGLLLWLLHFKDDL
jgi:hypothetical protein